MSASTWEKCVPDAEQQNWLDQLLDVPSSLSIDTDSNIIQHTRNNIYTNKDNNPSLVEALNHAEELCRTFIEELDVILHNIDDMSQAYNDVTSRTNNLMSNCESLLEQQATLQDLVHSINETLIPFNNVEEFAHILGIPFDAYGNKSNAYSHKSSTTHSATSQYDPRSSEFLKTMNFISTAMKALSNHPHMRDANLYRKWLKQLQNRAHSITTRNMHELLTSTDSICKIQLLTQLSSMNKDNYFNYPLESLAIYTKFRALGFRMRQLSSLLPSNYESDILDDDDNDNNTDISMSTRNNSHLNPIVEVKQNYTIIRTNLLQMFINDIHKFIASDSSLCSHIRSEFSYILRIIQLEQQLFLYLFKQIEVEKSDIATDNEGVTDNSGHAIFEYAVEVESVLESLCTSALSFLRPTIIKETSIDELCKVVSTLADDTRGQMQALKLPKALTRRLAHLLEETVYECQERLAFCAELVLRQDIQLFEPLPSQLSYPQIIENVKLNQSIESDMTKTWYPPLTSALSLLSRIYGVVEKAVFEDFSRRTVDELILSLRRGCDGIKKKNALHGDLFLIRHILILREQLTPFEASLQTHQKHLDFAPTSKALSSFSSRSLLRFDSSNGLIQLAVHGLPGINDSLVDTKKEIDSILKLSCLGLKQSAIKMILGPVESFLAKVAAYGVELPFTESASKGKDFESSITVSPEIVSSLKAQSFMKPERVKEMLTSSLDTVIMTAPDLKGALELYIENQVARSILMKPVLHEIDTGRKKLTFIIKTFVDNSSHQRDFDSLLSSISASASSGLN